MRDENVTTPVPPGQMTLGDDAGPTPEELQAAELSRAAREAVRQPADPRIDRQLAHLGLAVDDEPTEAPPAVRPQVRAVRAEDLERLEEELTAARDLVNHTERRLNLLIWVVTLEGIAVAILAVLLLFR